MRSDLSIFSTKLLLVLLFYCFEMSIVAQKSPFYGIVKCVFDTITSHQHERTMFCAVEQQQQQQQQQELYRLFEWDDGSVCMREETSSEESWNVQWILLWLVVATAIVTASVSWCRLTQCTMVNNKRSCGPSLVSSPRRKHHPTTNTRSQKPLLFLLLLSCSCFNITAQQAPLYTTPKFDGSQNHKRDMCDRQQALYANNITLSQALKGLQLSVVLTNYQSPGSKPFFTLNEKGVMDEENPGLFAIILDELATRAGFSWRNTYGVVLPIDSTTDGNKTWSDLLKWEVETYDISAGKWDRSIARMRNEISFPEGWYDSSMILIHFENDASNKQLHIWSFFLPFQWSVWVLLVATTLITGIAYWFLERLDTSSDEREMEHRPGDAIFYTSIIFTGHFEFRPRTSAAMIVTFSTTFIALIIGAVYTANLASFLVARRAPSFTIDSVKQAVLMRAPICVQAKVNIDDYLSEKYPDAVLVHKSEKEGIHKALRKGECLVGAVPVSAYEQFSRYSSVNADCSLKWNGKVENIVPAGFASEVDSGTLCTSLISHVLDLHLVQMKADGFIDREWEAHLQRTGDHNCVATVESTSSLEDEMFSLGVPEMAGIFIIHAMLLGFAIIVALMQSYRSHRIQASASQRQLSDTAASNKIPHDSNDESAAAPPDDFQSNSESADITPSFADQAVVAGDSDAHPNSSTQGLIMGTTDM